MTRMRRSLDELASRGQPRGANHVLTDAMGAADATARPIERQARSWQAFAGAFGGILVVGVLLATLLPDGRPGPFGSGPHATSQDGVILLVAGSTSGGDDALIYGQLVVGQGGCLAVSWADAGTFPLVFPSGSQFVPGAQVPTVSVPGSGNVSIGQWVIGGGGYHSNLTALSNVPEIPAECAPPGTEVAIAWTIRPEPTSTTLWIDVTLPPTSPTPMTVPQGAALHWYDFLPGTIQMAWRSTDTGTEMCWRTVDDEQCVDDDFRAPEVVIIPHGRQVVVVTRPPLTGTLPERVILELSNGDTMDVAPLYQAPGLDLHRGLSRGLPDGVAVVSARTADWPELSCRRPPASALRVSGSAFELSVSPNRARAGGIIELFVGDGMGGLTGTATYWQCWDGSTWLTTHVSAKTSLDSSMDPQVWRIESDPVFGLAGIPVPDTLRIRVPDLPPGTYRIEDQVGATTGWVIVEIIE